MAVWAAAEVLHYQCLLWMCSTLLSAMLPPQASGALKAGTCMARQLQSTWACHRHVCSVSLTDGVVTPSNAMCRYMGAEAGAGSPPENTLEAMGPVLESVLGSLTQEYEKRLFSKDHEVKGAQVSLLLKFSKP